jgi:uncharacterized membrane protein
VETFVTVLHVAAAIVLIGPLVVVTMASPRAINAGDAGLAVLRWLHRTTRVYGLLSIVVFLLGLWLVPVAKVGWGEFWLSSSMTLYVVALALLFGLVERDQRKAIAHLEAGETSEVKAGRIAGVAGAVSLIWIVIVLLMVWRPGQPG